MLMLFSQLFQGNLTFACFSNNILSYTSRHIIIFSESTLSLLKLKKGATGGLVELEIATDSVRCSGISNLKWNHPPSSDFFYPDLVDKFLFHAEDFLQMILELLVARSNLIILPPDNSNSRANYDRRLALSLREIAASFVGNTKLKALVFSYIFFILRMWLMSLTHWTAVIWFNSLE